MCWAQFQHWFTHPDPLRFRMTPRQARSTRVNLNLSILILVVMGVLGLTSMLINLMQRTNLRRGLEDPSPLFEELRADVTQDRSVSAIMGVIRHGTPAGRVIGAGLEHASFGPEDADTAMQRAVHSELAPSARTAAWLAATVILTGVFGIAHLGWMFWMLSRSPLEWSLLPAVLVTILSALVMLWAGIAHNQLMRLRDEVQTTLEAVKHKTLRLLGFAEIDTIGARNIGIHNADPDDLRTPDLPPQKPQLVRKG